MYKEKREMSKLRQYGFWISLTGAVILLLQVIGKQFGFAINEQFISEFVTAICGILVILGIIIKPSDNDSMDSESDQDHQSDTDDDTNDTHNTNQ